MRGFWFIIKKQTVTLVINTAKELIYVENRRSNRAQKNET